jgi:hypothetical protein
MLRDVLVATAALKLGDRTDLNAAIINEFQVSQEMRLEQNGRFQPWFMISEDSTITTVVGEPRVALPTNFVAEVEESGLWYYDAPSALWIPIEKAAEDLGRYHLTSNGPPQAYSVLGDVIRLHPAPDAVYTLRMRYAGKQAALTTNIENTWLKYASDLLLYDACERLAAENLQNANLALVFGAAKTDAWERLYVLHESRQHINRSYQMGG